MIYNVGGTSQNRLLARVSIQRRQRRQFTLAQRRHIVTLVDRAVQEDGVSFIRAAENLQVSAQSVRRWRDSFQVQDTTNPQGRDDATQNHRGPARFLDDIQEELISFVSEWRDRGMPVTRFALVRKIGRLKPEFLLKSSAARLMCISCFLSVNNLVHRVATHTAQRPPDEVHEDSKSHFVVAVPKCVGPTRDPRFVLNMDQTNSKFGNLPGQTIDPRGARTINMRTGTDDSKRCTVALTVTASGEMITPMVIYKGTRYGRIATRELLDQTQEIKYAMQPKAWFDEATMLDWVDDVLKPYVATAPVGIIPIMFLDSFKVHLLGSVADAIQGLGVELEIIPPGCTGLVQPIDVGINKPFKANMRKIYTEWLLKQDADAAIPSASCLNVSAWILESVKGIKKETIVNSWRKTGFSYFE
jgi:transposase-like protein